MCKMKRVLQMANYKKLILRQPICENVQGTVEQTINKSADNINNNIKF